MAEDAQVGVLEIVETVEHLEFEETCDGDRDCAVPPTWMGRLSCCGAVRLSCSPHRTSLDGHLLLQAFGVEKLAHNPCGQQILSIAWEPYRKADR